MRYRPGLGVYFFTATAALLLLGACEEESVAEKEPLAAFADAEAWSTTAARHTPAEAPVAVRYRLLATPRVGQPFELEVSVIPLVDAASVEFALRPDENILISAATRSFTVDKVSARIAQRRIVSATPQREGRFYINVDASVFVHGEMQSRTVTIPIQVGIGGPELEKMGETMMDAEGNRIISLPAKQPTE